MLTKAGLDINIFKNHDKNIPHVHSFRRELKTPQRILGKDDWGNFFFRPGIRST